MRFVAVDVETANEDYASICQVGVVRFEGGEVAETFSTLVDPREAFSGRNIDVHGITPEAVKGSPTFGEVAGEILARLAGEIVVCHTPFDRLSIHRACTKHSVEPAACRWLDSARVARRTWPHLARSGYGLKNVADDLGIAFRHHDASEDARAAGEVVLRAVAASSLDVEQWVIRALQPVGPGAGEPGGDTATGDPNGPLAGETVVFTGALVIPRREATRFAAKAGCDVAANLSQKTTILIVGDQDIRRLAGHVKSGKHRKAEEMASNGHAIRVLCESDFVAMMGLEGVE